MPLAPETEGAGRQGACAGCWGPGRLQSWLLRPSIAARKKLHSMLLLRESTAYSCSAVLACHVSEREHRTLARALSSRAPQHPTRLSRERPACLPAHRVCARACATASSACTASAQTGRGVMGGAGRGVGRREARRHGARNRLARDNPARQRQPQHLRVAAQQVCCERAAHQLVHRAVGLCSDAHVCKKTFWTFRKADLKKTPQHGVKQAGQGYHSRMPHQALGPEQPD